MIEEVYKDNLNKMTDLELKKELICVESIRKETYKTIENLKDNVVLREYQLCLIKNEMDKRKTTSE